MSEEKGYIYILTNPSFPEWIKIGYADDVQERVKYFNSKECVPFSFRIYATYEVSRRLMDKPIHEIIDIVAPNLRSVEMENDKIVRRREFYRMTPENAFKILECISKVSNMPPPCVE